MRTIGYSVIVATLFNGLFLVIHQTLPSILLQGVANLTVLHLVALLIVHFTQQHRRRTISFYLTAFTIIILLPVFLTMTELLLNGPNEATVTRFLFVIPVSYFILFITVVFSILMYQKRDSSNVNKNVQHID